MKTKFKIWWIPNFPKKPYQVEVKDLEEAFKVYEVLMNYDLYLGNNLISSNAGGLEYFDGENWSEWYDEDDLNIYEHIMNKNEEIK